MDITKTGGPAFPAEIGSPSDELVVQTGDRQWLHPGMMLRDYFAAKALQSLIAVYEPDSADGCVSDCAEAAYLYADEMMKARG